MAKVTNIQLYYSATASTAPIAGMLLDGELAINTNTADGKLYYKDSAGSVQMIASRAVANRETTTQPILNVSSNSVTLSGVTITGTAGQFSCSATTTLSIGNAIVISGAFGGTGSITGYSNPTTYLISATNGTTTFTLTTTTGAAIVTTAGTPTGLTYTKATAIINVSSVVLFTILSSGYTITVLLPDATTNSGKTIELFLGNIGGGTFVVNSASANIVRNSTIGSTNILTAGTCDWVKLYSYSNVWYVMASGKIV